MARTTALLALVAALGVVAVASAGECCTSFSGVEYSNCNCLEDGREIHNQVVAPGEYVNYHWRLTRWHLIDVDDEDRPELTIRATPCSGNAWLFVTPVTGPPFPRNDTARWAARKESETNSITHKMYYGEVFVSVYGAADVQTNYSIVAIITPDAVSDLDPVPGNNGTVDAQPKDDQEEILFPGDLMAMMIIFTTADVEGAEYMVYASPRYGGEDDADEPCGVEGDPASCIQTTACGLAGGPPIEKMEAWEVLPPNEEQIVEVGGLEQNQEYTFNVVVRTPNRTIAYTPTQGTPTFTRVGQLQDDNTIIIVACSVGGLFVLLVCCIIWAKNRLNKAYQVKRFGRKGFSKVGKGADAK
uniref:Uncharacterized protein n=1 Tax=Bicosoecida sp. CB-2014 TaxID=1486930 RepID=A0A7S1C5F1_9STRA|mmetsp:Transcript_14474/g.50361  ORF Transcript_14474/g.50361 Transcript_14474/m.50361 type:complete len:357 (+) Transcript_14474:213-1283(+)